MQILYDIEQGSQEWLNLRKTKITATDASVIIGKNPWKTKLQLYNEKISDENNTFQSERMKRGVELEPVARDLFILKTGIFIKPAVVVKDIFMCSLDGLSEDNKSIVEIKCPSEEVHQIAVNGNIPDYYYPQLQHQMYVCDLDKAYYFSFDGIDGVTVEVERDQEYIDKMIEEEKKFYEMIINKKSPEPDFILREDTEWARYAERWNSLNCMLEEFEKEKEKLREKIISLTNGQNIKGCGIVVSKFEKKGNVDYSKIPELKNINLDQYRKSSISSWRISCV